jgi:hypothetical protein
MLNDERAPAAERGEGMGHRAYGLVDAICGAGGRV